MQNKSSETPGIFSEAVDLSDAEFKLISEMLERLAGIHLSVAKKTLVVGRLSKRLRHLKLDSFKDYFSYISNAVNKAELAIAVDLLTTNETSFFREPKHFDFLNAVASAHPRGKPFRVWSAACSSGQEPYTIALVLSQALGESSPWEVVASDLSERVLNKAKEAFFPIEQAQQIPQELLKKYGLKGRGEQANVFTFEPALKRRISFKQLNLTNKLPDIGSFDVIFLRNVLIYFQVEIKKKVVENVVTVLKPGGTLLIGHSESLHGVTDCVKMIKPTTYQKGEK
ncbi:MAG: methyltransferase [Gammaproteobacteria bacterium]|nr:methyltransferase [Gammaproteobacteria bacterium]